MTGRENIQVNASLLGLTAKELHEQFDSIVDFAEIGQFIDEPLRKCRKKIDELVARGVTLLFVSHAMESVLTICERAICLSEGRLRADGKSAEVIAAYRESMNPSLTN